MDNLKRRVYVAGHRGMVGSAIVRQLEARGYENIVTRIHGELDLTNQEQVSRFFRDEVVRTAQVQYVSA